MRRATEAEELRRGRSQFRKEWQASSLKGSRALDAEQFVTITCPLIQAKRYAIQREKAIQQWSRRLDEECGGSI
jgi:hypothetical protein